MTLHELSAGQQPWLPKYLSYPQQPAVLTITFRCALQYNDVAHFLHLLVDRFEALRTRIVRSPDGDLLQQVLPTEEALAIGVIFHEDPDELRSEEVRQVVIDPFRLCTQIEVDFLQDSALIVLRAQHCVLDGWSIRIVTEFAEQALRRPYTDNFEKRPVLHPRDLRRFESTSYGVRNTDHWIDYHRSISIAPPCPNTSDEAYLECDVINVELSQDFTRLVSRACKEIRVTVPTILNGLLLRSLHDAIPGEYLSLSAVSANRHIRELKNAVSCLTSQVWVCMGTERIGSPEWYQELHRALLLAYSRGIYDWGTVANSAGFKLGYLARQHLATNVLVEQDFLKGIELLDTSERAQRLCRTRRSSEMLPAPEANATYVRTTIGSDDRGHLWLRMSFVPPLIDVGDHMIEEWVEHLASFL